VPESAGIAAEGERILGDVAAVGAGALALVGDERTRVCARDLAAVVGGEACRDARLPSPGATTGMRVKAVWRPEREGHIADIACFVPEDHR
jgi:hypothetical protein